MEKNRKLCSLWSGMADRRGMRFVAGRSQMEMSVSV